MRIDNEPSSENAPGKHRSDDRPLIEQPHLREEATRPASWLEVFFDLVFVVAVDQIARRLGMYELSWSLVVGYLLLYAMVWWAWVGYVIYNDRFGTDDLTDRLFTLAQMLAVLVLAVRGHDALESGATGFAAAYGTFRLLLAVRYVRAARAIPKVRRQALQQALGYGTAGAIFLASLALSPHARLWSWAVAFLLELFTPWLVKGFHHLVPPDPQHLEERFGTFINIVLGIGFVGLVDGMRDLAFHDGTAVAAVLVVCSAFATWWVYFETLDVAPLVAIERDARTGPYKLWLFAQLPLAAGLAATGVAAGAAVHMGGEPALATRWRILLGGSVALSFLALALLQLAYAGVGGGTGSRRLALRMLISAVLAAGVLLLDGQRSVIVMSVLAAATVLQVVWLQVDRARRRARLTAPSGSPA